MTLLADGERMIPENYRSSLEDYVIYLMHVASYEWAALHVRDKRVLDFGCGTGYGSAELSNSARTVDGIDSSSDAIDYASYRFQRPNLRFSCIDARRPLPFPNGAFDAVVSFQVIEHVGNDEGYIAEAHRVLAPGGQLLLITPNRVHRLLRMQRPWNRWHVREYDEHSLCSLVSRHFATFECLGMTGDECFTRPEIDRCRRLKWSSLPFTLPVYPDSLRVTLLNMVHRIKAIGAPSPSNIITFDFDISAVRIVRNASPSLNLVVSATR